MEFSKGECPEHGAAVPGGVRYLDPLTPLGKGGKAALSLVLINRKTWILS